MKRTQFTHSGRDFEIRATPLDNEVKVRLFEGNKPASPIVYSVSIETAFDARMRGFALDLVDELMHLMEHDTRAGRLRLYPKGSAGPQP
jgi:hypothetical protein